ncbi:S9 family peptidase [Secundilactobacillus yichangensis]|uniref:S9 family peptidase n=1 Tax=Secundilactobacillus yichangensis TaxID=2799580 RepID=UPI00194404CA|nr:prolyl oligopeptidase family serine peptidase [Secundilactobacillus yichangensis]
MKTTLTEEDLYEITSLSQPVVSWNQVFATNNLLSRTANDYTPQIVAFSHDYREQAVINPDLFASKDGHAAKDYLYYKGQLAKHAPFTLFEHRNGQPDKQVSPYPVDTLVTAKKTNRVFFKVVQTNEKPITQYSDFPTVRHVTAEHFAADEYGFLPNQVSYDLYEYDADSKTQTQLLSSPTEFKLCDANADGSQLVLIMAYSADDENHHNNAITVLDTQTGALTNLTQAYQNWLFDTALYSPQATKLLVSAQNAAKSACRNRSVYEYDFADSKLTDVCSDLDENLSDEYLPDNSINLSHRPFAWRDETHFYFLTQVHGHSKLYSSNGKQIQVACNEDVHVTDWTLDPDGQVLACYTTGDQPSLLGTLKAGTFTADFNVNQAFDEAHEFSKPEKFTYSAKDGLQLEGWLYQPLTSQKDHLPLFLYIHGGPHCAWGNTFFLQMQVLAAAGYGVVLLNPRGSASYGAEFMKADQGAYGDKDYTDLLTGMDYVLEHHPEFDPKKQYVGGLSFGGYMSSWMIGHTDRFAGAVIQNPLTDFVSFMGTSDIGIRFTTKELLTQTTDVKRLWQFSPLAYADHVSTPTFLMSSEWDWRCPISQAEEFYTALKHRNVDVEMTRFPQSWHAAEEFGLPNIRFKWMTETRRWLDAH